MLCDDDYAIRELGIRKILNSRQTSGNEEPRPYKLPELNLKAKNYHSIILWNSSMSSDPPLLKNISTDKLKETIQKKEVNICLDHIKDMPCHTQAVERAIKDVTEASSRVYGEERRDGMIRTRRQARREQSSFESKKDFNV